MSQLHGILLIMLLCFSLAVFCEEAPDISDVHVLSSTVSPISNDTDILASNSTSSLNGTSTTKTTTLTTATLAPSGAEEEKHSSLSIFFILAIIAVSILVIHFLLVAKFHYLPESIAVILIGAVVGLTFKLASKEGYVNLTSLESFNPTVFFLILLPPIIFEGGYNLHKGNFFQNIGSISVFAVLGTAISAVIVGGGIYLLGKAEVAHPLSKVESFALGSLISAVDPVATLAIFHAIDTDPVLYMLVFGESVLNDAVSIVLTTSISEMGDPEAAYTASAALGHVISRFCVMFFASSAIGVAFGLVSATMLKFIDLRKTPSLEFAMMLIFAYTPYGLAEGLHLSGIMAILFCGIVMSHYTHLNLSPVTQITVQQTFRTISFMAETCVFAYLGLQIFSYQLNVKVSFCVWSVILILIGRAFNIFPLAALCNLFRDTKITPKMQFIMWFSGLRGAVAFALSLHLEMPSDENKRIVVTSTLFLVMFTVLFLGGGTMPLLKCINLSEKKTRRRRRKQKEVSLSKTKEMGEHVDSENYTTEYTTEDEMLSRPVGASQLPTPRLSGFSRLDLLYLRPFFTRRLTRQEVAEAKSQMNSLTSQWYKDIRTQSESEELPDESDEETTLFSRGS